MAHLLHDLAGYFKLDETNIDNWTFKLFYKASAVLCMCGATVGIATQYFGDPISCEFQGINSDLAQDFCWIHGTSYIPPQYQPHMKCIVELEGIESVDDAPDTSYYQWVTFIMAIHAGVFYAPYFVWSILENGLMSSFGTDGKSPVMVYEDMKYDDGVVMEAVVERFVKYFKSIFHHNNWYFTYFVFCEFLNFFLLILQFWVIDNFLNNKFRWFGWEVVEYYSWSFRDRQNRDLMLRNPLCAVFPTEVSCNIPNVGAAGNEQAHNGLCVLTQNIINEKMYLVLWFWFMLLFIVSTIYVFYRIGTIFFDRLRFTLIFKTVRHKYDEDITKCLEYVLAKAQVGDWFVLYQLSKNCNPYFFREFIRELAIELKLRPKKSKSRGSVGNGTMRKDLGTMPRQPDKVKDMGGSDRLLAMFTRGDTRGDLRDLETGSRAGDQHAGQPLTLSRKLSQSELSSVGSDSPGASGHDERGSLIGSDRGRGPRKTDQMLGRPVSKVKAVANRKDGGDPNGDKRPGESGYFNMD